MYAKYTVVLKNLLEDADCKARIDKALSTYPIYETKSENEIVRELLPSRERLNKKLLDLYKYREIGFETPARFFDELEIAMCEIMPYYNQLFRTVEIMNELENIFENVDMTETYTETRTNTSVGKNTLETSSESESTENKTNTTSGSASSTNNTDNTDNAKSVKSDTPQGQLDIGTKNIDSVDYADTAQWNENQSSANSSTEEESEATSTTDGTASISGSGTSTEDRELEETSVIKHEHTRQGNQGIQTFGHDMEKYRGTITNVEQRIINDKRIRELFMLVY